MRCRYGSLALAIEFFHPSRIIRRERHSSIACCLKEYALELKRMFLYGEFAVD